MKTIIKKILFCLCLYVPLCMNAQQTSIHYIPVADSKVYAEETGSGDALILLHAGNLDHRMWKQQVTAFSKTFRVITIDIRGCGLTEDGDSTYLQSAAIAAVMDSLRIDKASLAGVSLGAVSSLEFALDYPGRVNKLVLVSPRLTGMELTNDTMLLRCNRRMDTAWKEHDTLQYINLFVNVWADGPHRKSTDMNQAVRNEIFTMASENIRKRKEGVHLGLTYHPNQLERLSLLHSPVLVITGSLDVLDINMAAGIFKKHGAKTIVVPNVAHMLTMENPEVFNKEAMSFLSEK